MAKEGGHSDMHKGLTNRSPSCEDSSTKLPTSKTTVDNEATRSETAPALPAQGPRVA
jgi:hypothetical protein